MKRKLALLMCACVISACAPLPHARRANTTMATSDVAFPSSPGQWDDPPRFISGKAPVYPIKQALDGKSGEATIQFTIAEDGTTKDFKVLKTDQEYFAVHTIIAIRAWRFQPAMKNGKPISARVSYESRFVSE